MSSTPQRHDHEATFSLKDKGSLVRRKQRHPRKPTSCEPCRSNKQRCDRQLPCGTCKRRDDVGSCRYRNRQLSSPQSHSDIAHPVKASLPDAHPHTARVSQQPASSSHSLGHPPIGANFRLETQDFTCTSWDSLLQRPAQQTGTSAGQHDGPVLSQTSAAMEDLLALLPAAECCDYLIIQYFTYVAPMFHILHEGAFQKRYNAFRQNYTTSDLSWVALLFSMFSLSVQTMEQNDPVLATIRERIPGAEDNASLAKGLRQLALAGLSRDDFIFHYNLTTLESLLIILYGINHDNGVDAAWTLLGLALNMAIALKCNALPESPYANDLDEERRWRCWIGLLSLYTYQTILFRDLHTRPLLRVVDADSALDFLLSAQPSTGTQVMGFKVRLFRLAGRICSSSLDMSRLDNSAVDALDAEVGAEQALWDAAFLHDGSPSILDTVSYAHWCFLQFYAHQLYLLLHRPFCRLRATDETGTGSSRYRQSSRHRCITSAAALLELHRRYDEVPRLRHHRWAVYGMLGSCTVHGAMALASCLLDDQDDIMDLAPYRQSFDAAVDLIGKLQSHSTIYTKAYPILRHIQTILKSQDQAIAPAAPDGLEFRDSFESWMSAIQWFDTESVDWNYWEDIAEKAGD